MYFEIVKVSAYSETEPFIVRHPVTTLNNENGLKTSKFTFPRVGQILLGIQLTHL